MNKKDIIKIIDEWYSSLSYTRGVCVRLQKACSDYNIQDLKSKIVGEQQ